MGIISWIFFGFIVGLLARLFVPGPSDIRGCLPTILLGILGSVVGGFIGRGLGLYPADEVQGGGIFMSILGGGAGAGDLSGHHRQASASAVIHLRNSSFPERRRLEFADVEQAAWAEL